MNKFYKPLKVTSLFQTFIPITAFTLFLFFISGSVPVENVESADSVHPHIVIIFVDDMGYGDVGSYNEQSKIPTPYIDGLAGEGIRFMDAHAPGAVCHPSRYGLLTGRYPFRTDTSVWPDEPVIEEGRMTIASLLRSQGYWTDIQGAFWREGGIAPDLELIDVMPRFTEESIKIIEEHDFKNPDQPLFLYVSYPAPHTPWLPTEEFEGVSEAGMYGDFMAMVDAEIGKILSAIEQTNMSEETLVIFTSDNGPVWYEKDTEHFGHDSNGGLRGMKGDAHEGGHRMPFIVRWPGVVEAGSVTNQTISFTDLLATFADITGTDLQENAAEDSFSILPVLTGSQPETQSIRLPVVSTSSRGLRAIQDGTWKLIDGLGSGGFTTPAHIEPGPGDPPGQLYNLEEDLAETNNLWNEYPEVVDRLSKMLDEWDASGRSRP